MKLERTVSLFIRGGALTTALKFLGAGLNYLLIIVAARYLNTDEFGAFGILMSLGALAATVVACGQPRAIVRFIPEFEGDEEELGRHKLLALVAIAALSAASFAIAGLTVGMAGHPFSSISLGGLMVALTLGVAIAWSDYLSSASRAEGLVLGAVIQKDIYWRLICTALVFGAGLVHVDISAVQLVMLFSIILLLVTIKQASRTYAGTVKKWPPRLGRPSATWWSLSTAAWGVSVLGQIAPQTGVLLAGAALGAKEAGLYFAIDRTSQFINLGLNGLNNFVGPQLSRYFHKRQYDELRRLFYMTCAVGLAVGAVCTLIFWLFSSKILSMFSPDFVRWDAAVTLAVLSTFQLINAGTGPVGWYLQMTGKQTVYLLIMFAANCVGLLLMWPLSLAYGIVGTACAAAITGIAWNLIAFAISARSMNTLRTDWESK
jgi:O-antigen/teichoic acid export membrane protein